MLRWRLILGAAIVAAVVGLCWADHLAPVPGIVLYPLLVALVVPATGEVLHLAALGGMRPKRLAVYAGNLLVVTGSWAGPVCFDLVRAGGGGFAGWSRSGFGSESTMLALAAAVVLTLAAEMRQFKKPGGVTVNIAAAVFAVVYLGFLLSFMVQLRMQWGVGGLASLLIVVKLGDTGAYAVGRFIGRHKMTPGLSPGKTVEGALGAVAFSCVGSWIVFGWLVPSLEDVVPQTGWWWRSVLFGLLVSAAGMAGDLAESLLKRDAEQKDSSSWIPGFGGVLDVLDSILLAGPVAYICWAFGLVG